MSHPAIFVAIPYTVTVRTFVTTFAFLTLSTDTLKGILFRVGTNDLNILIHPGRWRGIYTKIAAALPTHVLIQPGWIRSCDVSNLCLAIAFCADIIFNTIGIHITLLPFGGKFFLVLVAFLFVRRPVWDLTVSVVNMSTSCADLEIITFSPTTTTFFVCVLHCCVQ